jgi:hypothetical protein
LYGKIGGAYRVLVGKPEGRRPSGIPKRNGEIILRSILEEWNEGAQVGSIWLRIETGGGLL